jgi:hypothetical protein
VPGIEGEAIAPMIASVANVTFSCSDSNQRSRIGVAAPARISTAFCPSVPSRTKPSPSFASCTRLAGRSDHGLGGVITSVGSRKSATRSSIASYLGSASASLVENLAISRRVSALSGPSISERPSGNGVKDDGLLGSISNPCRCSSSSRMISGRSRLFTYAAVETL